MVLLWVSLLASLDVTAVANPRASGGWVSDGAQMIDAAAEARLEAVCDRLHRDIDLEVAVVTVDAVGGDPRRFAVDLFNHWGVGDAETNNGLLIVLAKKERALETVTGTGLEPVLSDGWLKATQDRLAVPAFRRGDFGGGIEALLAEIERYLHEGAPAEGEPPPAAAPLSATPAPSGRPAGRVEVPEEDGDDTWLGLGLLGGFLGLGGAGVFGARRYRKWERTCPGCAGEMVLLDETADDAHIEPGQRSEERIGSIDHRVFWCGACSEAQVRRPNRAWLSGWKRCLQCGYRTMSRKKTVVSHATTTSAGRMRIDEDCENCSYHYTSYRAIPRITESSTSSSSSSSSYGSSSSSSSGGSFGGGSSSGGGASSSW